MTFKDYHQEMLTWYGAVEEWTNDTVTYSDAGIPDPLRVLAINSARRTVLAKCMDIDPEWVLRTDSFTWPGTAESVELYGAGRVLPWEPASIALISEVADGGLSKWPVFAVARQLRGMYEGAVLSSGGSALVCATARRASLQGTRMLVVPTPAADTTFEVQYTPTAGDMVRADLTSDRQDLALPAAVQEAVPIRAALNLGIKDVERRPQLEALWQEWLIDRFPAAARSRAAFTPSYPADTRTYSDYRRLT